MPKKISVSELYQLYNTIPIVDVRSPGEFTTGHIPGAYNIPLFSNEERAQVGTRYKKSGRDFAIELGLEIVGTKLLDFVKQAKKLAQNKTLILHCWRGGMRSASMAWLFETAGLTIFILTGGYKAYRNFNREWFSLANKLIILSGYTGSGKTDILKSLKTQGNQIIDLEGIANHKGSAFGAIGQEPQPSNEQFENNLALEWSKLNLNEPIWIEDESITMGKNGIPDTLFNKMRAAPVVRINIPRVIRAKRLVKEYACFDKQMLSDSIKKIESRLGKQMTNDALQAVTENKFEQAATITLHYYDKAYEKGLAKRNQETIRNIDIPMDNPDQTAKQLKQLLATI